MALEVPKVSSKSAAETAARQIVQQITGTAARIAQIRKNGLPENKALGTPAVSGADIDAELGQANIAVIEGLQKALE